MYSLFLSHFNRPSIFSTAFQKILYYHNLDNENPSSGGQVFHADRHQELSIRFSQFCESASNMENNLDTYNRRFSAILKVFEITKHKAEREIELLFCVDRTFPSLLFQTCS